MAQVQKTGYLSFNGVDYSAYGVAITEDGAAVDQEEATVWGSAAHVHKAGLPTNRLAVRLRFDPTPDATLHAAAQAGTEGALAWRYSSAATSSTNPEFQCTAFLAVYDRGSEVGRMQDVTLTFAFTTAVTRDVTP